jgi:hypothetical protein
MVRTDKNLRSMVRKGSSGPMVLALPLSDSSLAEWESNGFTQMQGQNIGREFVSGFHRSFEGGFINSGAAAIVECWPWGEGEAPAKIAISRTACAALPDGKSMIVLEKTQCIKECAFDSLRTIGWKIPNDVFNDHDRAFIWERGSANLKKGFDPEVIDTNSSWITVEGELSFVLGYGADSFKIHIPELPMGPIKSCQYMRSLYMNEICGRVEKDLGRRYFPGDILSDVGYAVMTGVSADECKNYALSSVESSGELRVVKLTTPERSWLFAANFIDEAVSWEGEVIAPGACSLKQI